MMHGSQTGLARGKEEVWYIFDCEPGATLSIGLTTSMIPDRFRAVAQDESLGRLIDWKAVKPGDSYFIPAGTVHAIGAVVMLVENRKNADVISSPL